MFTNSPLESLAAFAIAFVVGALSLACLVLYLQKVRGSMPPVHPTAPT